MTTASSPHDLDEADVVLVGISRTSKTPTSIYLANRGIKTANVPIVPGIPLPPQLEPTREPLVVGLVASPERIVAGPPEPRAGARPRPTLDAYVDRAAITEEIAATRKLCARHGWPMIDVTRRSIEETAAAILGAVATGKQPALELHERGRLQAGRPPLILASASAVAGAAARGRGRSPSSSSRRGSTSDHAPGGESEQRRSIRTTSPRCSRSPRRERSAIAEPARSCIGADQMLARGRTALHKPATWRRRGASCSRCPARPIQLHTAAALARNGETLWAPYRDRDA